jgi:hypothetical protein
MTTLRGFLSFLAAHGGGEARVCDLDRALAADGREVRSALRAQGIVRDALRATTVPCEGLGCAREVRELPRADGEPRRLFGICTRDPVECETVDISDLDVAQEHVCRDAFVAAVERALRLTPRAGAPKIHDADAGSVTFLGEERADGARRDVLLAWRAESAVVRALVAEAEAAGRPVRVLTLDALAEILTVRDGQLAALPRLRAATSLVRSAPPLPASAPPSAPALPSPRGRSRALDGLPDYRRWNEIILYDTDDDAIVGVLIAGHHRRLSCIDFGLATLDGRRPLGVFGLLTTVCAKNGDFTTRAFRTRENGKRAVSELRTALRATFALEDDPFERYSFRTKSWKPKFRAFAAMPTPAEAEVRSLRDGSR